MVWWSHLQGGMRWSIAVGTGSFTPGDCPSTVLALEWKLHESRHEFVKRSISQPRLHDRRVSVTRPWGC